MTIATFNIQVFGKTKASKPHIMAKLVDVVRKYDVVAVQEIKDKSGKVPVAFLRAINAKGKPHYKSISPTVRILNSVAQSRQARERWGISMS